MRLPALVIAPTLSAFLLAGCGGGGSSSLLPADPIQRAATCSVVTAANARARLKEIGAQLPVADQGAVLRPALLAGAEGESFAADRTGLVVEAMPATGDRVKPDDLPELTPLCAAAFPPTPSPAALPEDALTAALGCDELGDFMRRALGSQGDYQEATSGYLRLNHALDDRLPGLLAARGISGMGETQAEARKAMAAIVKLGEPTALLDACAKRYAA